MNKTGIQQHPVSMEAGPNIGSWAKASLFRRIILLATIHTPMHCHKAKSNPRTTSPRCSALNKPENTMLKSKKQYWPKDLCWQIGLSHGIELHRYTYRPFSSELGTTRVPTLCRVIKLQIGSFYRYRCAVEAAGRCRANIGVRQIKHAL